MDPPTAESWDPHWAGRMAAATAATTVGLKDEPMVGEMAVM